MKFYIYSLATILISLFCFLTGCQKSSHEFYDEKASSNSWAFQLNFGSAFTLTDNQRSTVIDLQQQIASINRSVFGFRDPVLRGTFFQEPDEYDTTGFLYSSSREQNKSEFQWRIAKQPNELWRFSNCSSGVASERRFLNCEAKAALDCISQRLLSLKGLDSEQVSSSVSRSLLINLSRSCGLDGSFKNVLFQDTSFKIDGNEITFSPSPIFSLVIYQGTWASYEDALVSEVAVATLPQIVPCSRADGLCLRSPVSLTECRDCQNLEKGTLYTIFFLEGLRQDYKDVRSLIYVP